MVNVSCVRSDKLVCLNRPYVWEISERRKEQMVRRAVKEDIKRILELLLQVDMVHHNGRPDLFKGPATKYNSQNQKPAIT